MYLNSYDSKHIARTVENTAKQMAVRVGCSAFVYHIPTRVVMHGNIGASKHPMIRRSTKSPAKFVVAAINMAIIPQPIVAAPRAFPTGTL